MELKDETSRLIDKTQESHETAEATMEKGKTDGNQETQDEDVKSNGGEKKSVPTQRAPEPPTLEECSIYETYKERLQKWVETSVYPLTRERY